MKRTIILLVSCVVLSGMLCAQNIRSSCKPAVIGYDSEGSVGEQLSGQPSETEPDSALLLNFHVVKSFGGDILPLAYPYDISVTSRLTVIVVFHSFDTLEECGVWSVSQGGKQVTGLTDRRLMRPQSEYEYPVKRRGIPLINTSVQSFSKLRGKSFGNEFVLGSSLLDSTESLFRGAIAECYVFDRYMKKGEALKIETYLALKYGITLIESDYVSSGDVVLWDYSKNGLYSNGIAGLGKDSVLGLEQKQGSSSEEPDLMTIYVGEISERNSDNLQAMAEHHYLVWGHDNGSLFCDVDSDQDYPLMGRSWLVQSTHSAGNPFSTTVRLRVSDYPDSTLQYYLVIDRSGRGDFGSQSVEYLRQSGVDTLGYVYFSEVVWDLDGSGTDAFTFSCKKEIEEQEDFSDTLFADKEYKQRRFPLQGSLSELVDSYYQLYPNPTTGNYRLLAELPSAVPIVVRVYTMQGSLLKTWQGEGRQQYLFEDYLQTQGNYVIEVETEYERRAFNLVVAR